MIAPSNEPLVTARKAKTGACGSRRAMPLPRDAIAWGRANEVVRQRVVDHAREELVGAGHPDAGVGEQHALAGVLEARADAAVGRRVREPVERLPHRLAAREPVEPRANLPSHPADPPGPEPRVLPALACEAVRAVAQES